MREILFRGKAINRDKGYHRTEYKNGEWVYGLVTKLYDEQFKSLPAEMTNTNGIRGIEIDYKTIGQYTGLTDKNGNKIFENDIVAYWDTYNTENGQSEADCIGKVIWDDETISFQVTNRLSAESYEVLDECSVIGNIFDNPELLFDNPKLLEE